MTSERDYKSIDELLHDADRAVGGIGMAQMMGDHASAQRMQIKAARLYAIALARDPEMADPAWQETGNREPDWLRRNGFEKIADIRGHS